MPLHIHDVGICDNTQIIWDLRVLNTPRFAGEIGWFLALGNKRNANIHCPAFSKTLKGDHINIKT
jgi:hypothetical protein